MPSLGPSLRTGVSPLQYTVRLFAPWRRSACLSTMSDGPAEIGQDTYTLLSEQQERALRASDTTQPKLGWMIAIHVAPNPSRLGPRQWLDASPLTAGSGRAESVRVAGRDAVRLGRSSFGGVAYVLALDDRAFVVALVSGEDAAPPAAREEYVVAMTASLERASFTGPAQPAPQSAESLADQLAAALAKRDLDALAGLIVPTCFFTVAVANAGPAAVHPLGFLDDLRAGFARGLTVAAQPRPVTGDPARPPLEIRATWTEQGAPRGTALLLWRQQGRWFWSGVVYDR